MEARPISNASLESMPKPRIREKFISYLKSLDLVRRAEQAFSVPESDLRPPTQAEIDVSEASAFRSGLKHSLLEERRRDMWQHCVPGDRHIGVPTIRDE